MLQDKIEIANGIIEYTRLGEEASGRGAFSAWVGIKFNGSGQGFGGYVLDEPLFENHGKPGLDRGKFLGRQGTAWGLEFIKRILETLEVGLWEDLKNTPVRVKREHTKIHAIGHFYKDKWFNPEEDLKHLIDT